MKIINNSSAVIIVLHEIYGINQHIQTVCEKFSIDGYDVICPNLLNLDKPFSYNQEDDAYQHFFNNIGFDLALKQVKRLIVQAKEQYRYVFILGYSIGATIAWLCCSEENICEGIIGYYGSRIRNYINITPKCPIMLIFSSEEKTFNIKQLVDNLKGRNIDVHILSGKHGFSDPFSKNYYATSSEKSRILVDSFLNKISHNL